MGMCAGAWFEVGCFAMAAAVRDAAGCAALFAGKGLTVGLTGQCPVFLCLAGRIRPSLVIKKDASPGRIMP